ncbi:MAG: glycosyltransferase family 4 protein, partial [Flavobacterium sp.]
MAKPIKIAVYSGEIPSTTFIERLIIGLSKKGCEVYLFGYLKSAKVYSNTIHVHGYNDNRILKFYLLLKYSILLFLFKRKEKQKLEAIIRLRYKNKPITKIKYYPVLWHQPDVFHLQWAKSIEDWIWVQEFGIKFVVSLRGTHISISPITNPKVLNRYQNYFPLVDGFHAVSKAIAKEVEKYGVESEKVNVVYSGLPGLVDTIEKKENNQIFKIISIGRNHWVKGYHYAIDCCKLLKEKGFQFEHQIVGAKGSEELEFLIQSNNLQNEVFLTDKKPFSEVQQIMKNADLLLL